MDGRQAVGDGIDNAFGYLLAIAVEQRGRGHVAGPVWTATEIRRPSPNQPHSLFYRSRNVHW
jgi:hypothetical protein